MSEFDGLVSPEDEGEMKADMVAAVKDLEKQLTTKETVDQAKPDDYSQAELDKAMASNVKFDPNGPYSPGEFNRRGELFDAYKNLKSRLTKETNQLKREIADIKTKSQAAEMKGYQRALDEIGAKRLQAVAIGDSQAFAALDRQYQDVANDMRNVVAPAASTLDADAQDFLERTQSWRNHKTAENSAMHDLAEAFEAKYRMENRLGPMENNAKVGREIEAYIKLRFPHRFENPAANKPQAVAEAGSAAPRASKAEGSLKYEDLSERQKLMCDQYIKSFPGSTRAQYIAEFEANRAKIMSNFGVNTKGE